MGAISGGLEKIWNKNNFSSTPPSNLNDDWSLKMIQLEKVDHFHPKTVVRHRKRKQIATACL